jgi:protein TonB
MRSVLQTETTGLRDKRRWYESWLVSAGVHAGVALLVAGVFHSSVRIAPYKLPGTASGVKLLTYYSPGSPEHAVSDLPSKDVELQKETSTLHAAVAPTKPKEKGAPSAEVGSGSSADSGLGEGDIKIASQTYFPYPKPNLSSLPHGTTGDVVLNAVIDENGKIKDLTLLKGLGPSIDDAVIAVVKQWSYTPATKNGVPVPSEQELHFHYERG